MSTVNQIRANQQNAQLSTGPRSVEGRAVVRRNALKSGIHAVAATALPFENLEDLEVLKSELYDQYAPATPVERDLLDDLIRDRWLLRRFVVIEDQIMAGNWDGRFNQDKPHFAIGHAYTCSDQTLARLHRRVTGTKKSYKETLALLEKMQSARRAQELEVVAPVAIVETARQDSAGPNVALPGPELVQPSQPEPLPEACEPPLAVIGFVPPTPPAAESRRTKSPEPPLKPGRGPRPYSLINRL